MLLPLPAPSPLLLRRVQTNLYWTGLCLHLLHLCPVAAVMMMVVVFCRDTLDGRVGVVGSGAGMTDFGQR